MPLAFMAQVSPLDWKGLGAILGVVLAALAVARIFGTPIAEKTILWVLREKVHKWDYAVLHSDTYRKADEDYAARARGWDITSVLAEANKDRMEACFAAVQSQGAEMRHLVKAVERCESNAETLAEIKDEVRENSKALHANAVELAAVKAIVGERRELLRREMDKRE